MNTETDRRYLSQSAARMTGANVDAKVTKAIAARAAMHPMTEQEKQIDAQIARASLNKSWRLISEALDTRCDEHGAAEGEPCWGSREHHVTGLCADRWSRAVEALADPKPRFAGEEQHAAADALRNAQRDARIREQTAGRQAAREVAR